MNKTILLVFLLTVVCLVGLSVWKVYAQEQSGKKTFAVQKSDAEWKAQLSPEAYRVLRHHDTERPNSSPLDKVTKAGNFYCAGCDHLLFRTEEKFDSGTGWPSFFNPANEQALGSTVDYKLIMARTEVHCARCGGHLGHVFNDGPKPTGKRYCINGVALKFKPKLKAD